MKTVARLLPLFVILILSTLPASAQLNNAKFFQGRPIVATQPTNGQTWVYSTSNHRWQLGSGGGGTGCTTSGSAGQLLTDDGAGGCNSLADFVFTTHTLAAGASGIFDLHSAATTAFKVPGGFTTGLLHVTTTTGATAGGLLVNADITNATIDLTTKVTGLLPLANGGTNCATPYAVNPQASTYQALLADFTCSKTISVASGTFTITLVASGGQPVAGSWIRILNYGSGVVTVARSGQNINGATTSHTLAAGSATAPTGILVQSDGTNYFAQDIGAPGTSGVTSVGGLTGIIGVASGIAFSGSNLVLDSSVLAGVYMANAGSNAILAGTGNTCTPSGTTGCLVLVGAARPSAPAEGTLNVSLAGGLEWYGAATWHVVGSSTSPLTTKGDLYGFSSVDARIPVGTNGQVLTADSTQTLGLKWATVSGTGDVVGPSSATDNAVVRFDSTTGKLVQNSVFIIDDSGNATTPGTITGGTGCSGCAGFIEFPQGTAHTAGTSSVGFQAPTSVSTKFMMNLPAAPATGFMLNTGTSDPSTISFVASSGSGSVCLTTSCSMTTPALGTPSAAVLTNATGTATGLTAGITNALKSASTTVDVSAATAPSTGQVLKATDSTHATWQTAGSGDVVGPSSATDNAFARFDGTTGKLIQNSTAATLDDSGNATFLSVSSGSSPPAVTPGTGGVLAGAEGTVPSVCAASAVDCLYWDSTQHGPLLSRNNGSYLPIPQGPASSTSNGLASWGATNGGLLSSNANWTLTTTTLTGGASAVFDGSAMATTAGFKIPVGAGAVPTADGAEAVNSTNHTHVWGSNGTTMVGAIAATGTGTATACTNQFVTVVSSLAVPTCTTVTLAGAQFANQGTTTTVLHGNGSGNPSFGAIVNADVTSIDAAAKLTGLTPIANGGTNSSATATAGGVGYGTGTAHAYTSAATAKQMLISGGAGAPSAIDFPQVQVYPAANCVNAVAGSGWSSTSTGMPAACRAGSNNFNGTLQAIPSTGGTFYLDTELPGDWDTSVKPYVSVYYGSGANTSGTVIWTISTGCTKQDGSVTDDPSWIAESAMGTQTMATANRMWAQNAQLAGAMTNCIAGSTMYIKGVLSGTASSAINISKLTVTVPRLLTVQAN